MKISVYLSTGGGDSVLVVEDGWLVSKAISRFKRDGEGKLMSKKIMEVDTYLYI
jgi:hypothetical protein